MSAAVFYIDNARVFLFSDGAGTRNGGTEVVFHDLQKIFKLSENTGLVWMGARPSTLGEIVQSVQGMQARQAIETIAEILQRQLGSNMHEYAKRLNERPYAVYTVEATPTGAQMYSLIWTLDPFTPAGPSTLNVGDSGALVVDRPGQGFGKWIQTAAMTCDRPFETQAERTEWLLRAAFDAMIDHYQKQGLPVGGQIFTETLKCEHRPAKP